jgi:hypothetical protein
MQQPSRPPRPLYGPTALWTGFMIAGAAVALAGIVALVADLVLSPRSAHADAVVVGVAEHIASRGQKSYQPVLEFTADGQRVRFEGGDPVSNRAAIRVGGTRRVVYDPGNPRDARLDTTWQRWAMWLALVVLGLVLILIGGLGRRRLLGPPGPPPVAYGA